MRIGRLLSMESSVESLVAQVVEIEKAGYDHAWATQIFGPDALTALAVAGAATSRVGLGTAVVPIYPRHPQMLAQQALTVQSASHDRLMLGIGLSHQMVVEGLWGMSYDKPARYMREYLSALMPMLQGEAVAFDGEVVKATTVAPLDIPDVKAPMVLVAALGATMLKLAGTVADGTATWMTGIKAIGSHIAPTINAAAEAAGRPAPRIVVALPVSVTNEPSRIADQLNEQFSFYPSLPSYRAMLDIEGANTAADIAIVGSREQVLDGLGRLAESGGTDLITSPTGTADERAATEELLLSFRSA